MWPGTTEKCKGSLHNATWLSNRIKQGSLATKETMQILIDEIDLPVIVDAGIGRPSQACEGYGSISAIMANTAIATAGNIPMMAQAFKQAIEAGRLAYLAKLGRVIEKLEVASSPLTGFLED